MSLELLMLIFIIGGLVLYTVLGGADFGAGVWEFNLRFSATPEERQLSQHAMGPVWEANHVWLIFVVVVLFSAFPIAFAAVSRALWLPLLLALLGIVLRGGGFALRYYGDAAPRHQAIWGIIFALASVLAPFFLGASVGAIASGSLPITAAGHFTGNYLTAWITPLSIYLGFFTVGLCAYLAAVFLCRDAQREAGDDLVTSWRRRALLTGCGVGVMALVGLLLVALEAEDLWNGILSRGWPLIAASLLAGGAALVGLWRYRFTFAVVAAGTAVAAVVAAWAIAQYPMLIPPAIGLHNTNTSRPVLLATAIAIAIGAVFLLPSLAWLLYLFKAQRPSQSG